MNNFNWKSIIIILTLLVFGIFFKDVVQFLTLVVTDFVDTVVGILRDGLSGRGGIEAVVRFCITIVMIIGLIKIISRSNS